MASMRSIPVHEETIERVSAFKEANPLNKKTYDEAVNELLDEYGFPQHHELDDFFRQLSESILGNTTEQHPDQQAEPSD